MDRLTDIYLGNTHSQIVYDPLGRMTSKQADEESIHYILKDNLGSWTTIADAEGVVEQELSFDAWGNRRNPETWQSSNQLPEPLFDRGFTGHEHLYAFGLINMNGRVYDPQMSSFLSVDAYVQSPENSQSFNRYAYCLNNPLKYTDPSGWVMIGGMTPSNPFHENWDVNFAEPTYTPRDFGLLQLSDADPIIAWMEENELQGGGSPVYDEHGYFLGTDDGGLQGCVIVMRREDFVQGMKHEFALSLATDLDERDKDAESRLYFHYRNLCNRPDWDGFVTINEGVAWAKRHIDALSNPSPENTLYIDASLLDLGYLTIQNSGLEVGNDYTNVNLYNYVNRNSIKSINTTYALGNTSMKLLDNQGTIVFRGDEYNWDYHDGSPMRNILVFFERARTGVNDKHGFKVSIYGTAKINKRWPF